MKLRADEPQVAVEYLSSVVSFQVPISNVALITIERPEARNAINAEVRRGLTSALDRTESSDDVWAVVLTGAGGRAFCAGADLKEVAAGRLREMSTASGGFAGFVYAERTRPWIAAVEGAAVAGGCEIVLACEMIVAAENSAFALPEVKRGLIASSGGLFRLPRYLPRQIAMELILTGDSIDAQRAMVLGMINAVCPPGSSVEHALNLAQRICVNAPLAVRESLAIARRAFDLHEAALRELSDERQCRLAETEDFKEGPRAFIEKRPPTWRAR